MSSSKSEEDGFYRRRSRPMCSRLFRVAPTTQGVASEVKRRRDRNWRRSAANSTPASDECATPEASAVTATQTPTSAADTEPAWRDALQLWLRWNTAHTELTSRMFEVQHNSAMMEDLLDQVEQLRLQAVKLSEQLIA